MGNKSKKEMKLRELKRFRRERRLQHSFFGKSSVEDETKEEDLTPETRKATKSKVPRWYSEHYKKLLIIPFAVLIIAIVLIAIKIAATGEFVDRGISLRGGLSVTILTEEYIDTIQLQNQLQSAHPNYEIGVRSLTEAGRQVGITIEAGVDTNDQAGINSLLNSLQEYTDIDKSEFSIEAIGSALGTTFFKQTLKAIVMAFLFMALVVFIYFGHGNLIKILCSVLTIISGFLLMGSPILWTDITAYIIGAILIIIYLINSIPSIAVILCAFSDILVTLAVFNLLGFKLSTAGVAAFLMLVGYSVDTDVLLTTKVLRVKQGTILDRVITAFKTGIMMTLTTVAAVTIALIFSQSETIKQIMIILLIGLLCDLLFTWIQNAGIIRWYMEKKELKEKNV